MNKEPNTANQQLLSDLNRWDLATPSSRSKYDCAITLIKSAIEKHHPLAFSLGTYFDSEMDEKPWHAIMWPSAFQDSAKGLRVKCNVEHLGESPLISGAEQMPGSRIILVSAIDAIWLVE